jgi:hypothetical protein
MRMAAAPRRLPGFRALCMLVAACLLGLPMLVRAATPPPPVTPALWLVQDADTKMYIFGTIHALPEGVSWFTRPVVTALDGSKRLILEVPLPEDPMGMVALTIRLGRNPASRPLDERVPPEWQPALNEAILRLKPGQLEGYDTWFVALTLSNLQTTLDGVQVNLGAESVLAERARLKRIPIEGLETAEQQLTYFEALPELDQQQLLIATLEGLPTARAELDATIADWLAGRKDEMAARVNREFEGSPILKQMLLGDRNARWAAQLAREMETPGQIFVAVGAGHLAGAGNLIEQLGRYGLKAERVLESPPKAPRGRRKTTAAPAAKPPPSPAVEVAPAPALG